MTDARREPVTREEYATARGRGYYDQLEDAYFALADRLAASERDCHTLNELLRRQGLGQGEIDSLANDFEDLKQRLAEVEQERDNLFTITQVLESRLANAQATIARKDEALEINRQAHSIVRDQLAQAEQQVARLRESSNDLVEFFTQNHEDVGEELYGRVNGKDLTPSAKRLNEMLTEMQQALRETGA